MTSTTHPIENRLLAKLPHAEYLRIQPHMDSVEIQFGQVLYEPGDIMKWTYFPCDSLVSLLSLVDEHLAVEVGMVGHEGLVGVALALGAKRSPMRAVVQGTGQALRMKATAFRQLLIPGSGLHMQTLLYTHALLVQIAQTAACNRFHVIEARLARWLLMTRDRISTDQFHLTHEFLGRMLGVRRVGVTNAAHRLKLRKLIAYSRGEITIVDKLGLEAAACSCYAATRLVA